MEHKTFIKSYTRRDILKAGTASAIAVNFLPSRVFGANERLAIAGIGVGGKGGSDINGASKIGDVVALCDVDFNRGGGAAKSWPKAKRYSDYRKMLDDMGKSIDACTVSTPDHNHAPAAIRAMSQGIHVYVQKPLTHTVWEARQMRLEAKKNKVCTQMGNQGTASTGLREGVEAMQSGAIGEIKEVHVWTNRPVWPQAPGVTKQLPSQPVPDRIDWNSFIGPAKMRPYNSGYHPFKWRGWWDYGTGALGDMACHTANLAYMGCQLTLPTWVEPITVGPVNPETYPAWAVIKMKFPGVKGRGGEVIFNWYEGKEKGKKKLPPAELFHGNRPTNSGSLVVGTKGILYSPNDYGSSWKLLPPAGGTKVPEYQKAKAWLPRNNKGDVGMKLEWAEAIKANKPELALSNFDYSANLTEAILMGNIAMKVGEGFDWNAKKLTSSNKKATALATKEYRSGWEIYSIA